MATFDTRDASSIMRAFQNGDLNKDTALSLLEPLSGGARNAAQFFTDFLNANPTGQAGSPQEGPGTARGQTQRDMWKQIAIRAAAGGFGAGAVGQDAVRAALTAAGAGANEAEFINSVVRSVPGGPSGDPRAGVPFNPFSITGDTALLGTDPNRSFLEDASRTRGDREFLFNNFVASEFGSLPTRFRNVAAQRFDPLSAAFGLQRTAFPDQFPGGNFREFLGTNPSGFTQQQFTGAFDALAPLFDPNAQLNEEQQGRRDFFDTSGFVPNLLQQFFSGGANPLFRNTINAAVTDRIRRFRDFNPGAQNAELFGRFLGNRSLTGGDFS